MQTNNFNHRHSVAAGSDAILKPVGLPWAKRYLTLIAALALLAMLSVSAQAVEVVRIVASPIGVTVPLNFTGTAVITNGIHIGGGSNAVTLSVSGLPAGVSWSFDANPVTADTTNHLTLTFTSSPPEGLYNVSIDATGGATGNVFILLQVGDVWNGSYQTAGNWSSSSSWVGGHVPGSSDDVIFTDLGAQTNLFTNSIVDLTTVGSVRFANVTNQYEVLSIPAGNTLSIVGTNGFTFLRNDVNLGGTMTVDILGGGNLVVSNQNANFTLLIENQVDNTLDMSGLGNFTTYVSRLGLGDYSLYPNYYNYVTNQYSNTAPRRFVPTIFFAKTNIVQALFVDPSNYANPTNRDYALCFDNSYSQGSTTHKNFNLGISNVFYADAICINHGNEGGNLQFNPNFARFTNIVAGVTNFVTNSMVAVFRNTNGGRMTMFAISDDVTPGPAVSNIKGAADFTGGSVDMLVDQLYICRDPAIIATNQTPNVQGQLFMSKGIVDANNVYIGFQEHTNRYQFLPDQDYRGYCEGKLVVSNTATFVAHGTITLGYTADTDPNAEPYQNFGQITVGPGGSLSANQIVVDGGAGLSSGNTITINSGGNLIVSNTIANTTQKLDTMTINSGALTLFVDGNNASPYAYVTNFNTSGSATINIASIKNFTPPVQVLHLVQYDAGTPTVVLGTVPSGYHGTIINNGAGSTIDVYVTTTVPKELQWHGYVNNNWDTTTKNWLDLTTGLQTNFATLDNVIFDDTPGVPTTINLAVASLTPTSVNVTNSANNYTLSGTGSIGGTPTMYKTGTGTVDVEGNTALTIEVNQGSLSGAGTINAATVDSAGAMLFSGNISANVVCAGKGTSSGTIFGSVDVQSGGTFTNLHNINGPLTLENGSFMKNSGTVSYPLGFTSTVSSNAFLLNLGTISGDLMQVSGTLEDDSGNTSAFTLTQLTIASGGKFIPGGTGVGNTYVKGNGNGNTPGRLTLAIGSTTVIKMNPGGSPANTAVWAAYIDYGPSQSGQDQNGGTLVISNVGAAFAAGQVFNVFGNSLFNLDNPGNTGSSTNSYPIMVPSRPGTGLSWDLSRLWPGGYIGVINTPVVALTNSFQIIGGTNIVDTFTWPTNAFQHWVLETQENPLNIGLSNNWTRIAGSWTNSPADLAAGFQTRVITNQYSTTNPAVFFRLAFP